MGIGDELRRASRLSQLSATMDTERLLRQIYIRAGRQLGRDLQTAKPGSLTERWLEDYKGQIEEQVRDVSSRIERATIGGMTQAAQGEAEAVQSYLRTVFENVGIADSFSAVLSRVPDDMLRQLIGGKMYAGGRNLSERVWNLTGRLQGGIEEVIAQGIAQQRSALQIAEALQTYLNPDMAIPYKIRNIYPDTPFPLGVELTDFRCLTLARTATNHVRWATMLETAKLNPLCGGIHWELSPAHYSRQIQPAGPDECDDYAAHDSGLGKGNFAIEDVPRPHPNCLCAQWQVVPEMSDAVNRLNRWLSGGSDPALDAGFERWRRAA